MNYSLNISLPKPLVELAKKQVKNGYYSSFSEVVRDALRNLLLTDVPQFSMSKPMEKTVAEAYQDYQQGKTEPIASLKQLE